MTDFEKPYLWQELKLCLGLLTRVPVRVDTPVPTSMVARASRWFPLVGGLIGVVSAGVLGFGVLLGLPDLATALIAIGAIVLLTGAIHEDGLADVADGFGGGFNRFARLEIMRDSRVGAYGVIALVLSIGLKAALLAALIGAGIQIAAVAVIVAAMASRLTPVLLMRYLARARRDGMAVAAGTPDAASVRIAWGLSLAGLLLLPSWPAMLMTLAAVLVVFVGLGALATRRIGGQTGDVLGAGQQVTELLVLLGLVVLAP